MHWPIRDKDTRPSYLPQPSVNPLAAGSGGVQGAPKESQEGNSRGLMAVTICQWINNP